MMQLLLGGASIIYMHLCKLNVFSYYRKLQELTKKNQKGREKNKIFFIFNHKQVKIELKQKIIKKK